MKKCLFLLLTALASAGCGDGIRVNPVMPSDTEQNIGPIYPPASPAERIDLSMWSPYIVVHTPGDALGAYQKAIPELISSGKLKGVRIEIVRGEGKNYVNDWISSVVPDTLWILDNNYLFEPNIEDVIDQVFVWYPNIRYLQIGNETTTILPKNGPQISIETYMSALKRIYNYIQIRYPSVILVSQSTFGAGDYGSIEVERMVELGLRTMSPSRLIIGMNIYSLANANFYSSVVDTSLRGYRIWVTETGTTNQDEHIGYVQQMYPFLRNTLRAERIYWYCLYCGESGPDTGFSLIKDVAAPSFWTSPLYDALAGR